MTVAFDAVGPSSSGFTSTSTTGSSWSHTTSGTNRVMIVDLACGNDGATLAVTYAGVSMTPVLKVHSNNQTAGFIQRFKLVGDANVASGTNTVAFTVTGGAGSIAGGSKSYNGADQTNGLGTTYSAFGSGGTASVAVTSNTSGNIIDSSCCDGSGTNFGPTGGTRRFNAFANNSSGAGASECATWAATGSSVTTSFSINADWWGIISNEVLSASAGPSFIAPPFRPRGQAVNRASTY